MKKIEKNSQLYVIKRKFEDGAKQYALNDEKPVNGLLESVSEHFGHLLCDGDKRLAVERLRDGLHELVTFRRNIIWKDMLVKGRGDFALKPVARGDFFALRAGWVAVAIAALVLLHWLDPISAAPEASRCLALLVALVVLWCTEAIPLYVTSLLVPPLVVLLRVLPGRSPSEAASEMVASMSTHTIMLILAGFSLASALSKFKLDKLLASAMLTRAGTRPEAVLLVAMVVSAFLSMWISNVAAPVLTTSIVVPSLRALPFHSAYRRTVLLGIAAACNVGGMLTPIASPQNIAALQALGNAGDGAAVSFGTWMACAVPMGAVILSVAYVVLLVASPPDIAEVPNVTAVREGLSFVHFYVIFVAILTVAALCAMPVLKPIVGDVGIVSVVPLVLFYAPGVLTKEDFNLLPWNVVYLVAGVRLRRAPAQQAVGGARAHLRPLPASQAAWPSATP